MSMDITSYLLSKGITDASSLTSAISKQVNSTADSDTSEFSDVLSTEANKLAQASADSTRQAEVQDLIAALDKSILGTVASTLDAEELANDLLTDKNGKEVIEQLVGGHMQAIVMTDSKDTEETTEDALSTNLTGESTQDTSTETLAQNLETIMENLNHIPSV